MIDAVGVAFRILASANPGLARRAGQRPGLPVGSPHEGRGGGGLVVGRDANERMDRRCCVLAPTPQGSPAKPGSALGYRLVRPKAGEEAVGDSEDFIASDNDKGPRHGRGPLH